MLLKLSSTTWNHNTRLLHTEQGFTGSCLTSNSSPPINLIAWHKQNYDNNSKSVATSSICTTYEDKLWRAARPYLAKRARSSLPQPRQGPSHQQHPVLQAGAAQSAEQDQMRGRQSLAMRPLSGKAPGCYESYTLHSMFANEQYSVGSLDEMLNGVGVDNTTDAWGVELADRIEEILARKGSTVQGREKCYKTYIHILTNQYAEEEVRGKEDELVAAFLKSIKEEKSENETVLAIKGGCLRMSFNPVILTFYYSHRNNPHNLPFRPNLRSSLNASQTHNLPFHFPRRQNCLHPRPRHLRLLGRRLRRRNHRNHGLPPRDHNQRWTHRQRA